jgi:hypothetical protein
MTRRNCFNTNDAFMEAVCGQRTAFVARFGRKPTPHDPLVFCWHSTTPKPMCDVCDAELEHSVVEAAKKAGIDLEWALKFWGIDRSLKTMN